VIGERLLQVRERIAAAAARSGRSADDVTLIAVSKTFPADRVVDAFAAGQRVFGENRVQEALAKIPEVAASLPGDDAPEWHLIGPLQRNKARRAVEIFDVIHSVDRPELARAIDRAAAAGGRRMRVLLQVNVDREPQKAGVAPEDAPALLRCVRECAALEPGGLMAIPRACSDPEEVRPSFARLRELLGELQAAEPGLPEFVDLSMGMSADFEVAIEEGSTQVRVGTAVFGRRDAK
jgi:pyridoxal phosphate enzyme (YggS family)